MRRLVSLLAWLHRAVLTSRRSLVPENLALRQRVATCARTQKRTRLKPGTYYNGHRVNQALGGQTPAGFGRGSPGAAVIGLDEVRSRKLVRTSFPHGLLNPYDLVEEESAAA